MMPSIDRLFVIWFLVGRFLVVVVRFGRPMPLLPGRLWTTTSSMDLGPSGRPPWTLNSLSHRSGRAQSSSDDAPKYTPQQISQLISQQQQQAASNPYTTTGTQPSSSQTSYGGGGSGGGTPGQGQGGGPLTPTSSMFSPGLSASLPTRDVSMRDATGTSSSSNNTNANNTSNSNANASSNQSGGVQLPSLSGLGLGGLGNVGMSLGGGSPMGYASLGSMGMGVPMGSVNPYARR